MAGGHSEAFREHLVYRGMWNTGLLITAPDNGLYEKSVNGNNAKAPYLPFGSDLRGPPLQQRQYVADYMVAKVDQSANLRNKSAGTSLQIGSNVKPALFSVQEMARLGAVVHPQAGSINPVNSARVEVPMRRNAPHGTIGTYRSDLQQ